MLKKSAIIFFIVLTTTSLWADMPPPADECTADATKKDGDACNADGVTGVCRDKYCRTGDECATNMAKNSGDACMTSTGANGFCRRYVCDTNPCAAPSMTDGSVCTTEDGKQGTCQFYGPFVYCVPNESSSGDTRSGTSDGTSSGIKSSSCSNLGNDISLVSLGSVLFGLLAITRIRHRQR